MELYTDCWSLCIIHRQVCIALCTMIIGHYALCVDKLV